MGLTYRNWQNVSNARSLQGGLVKAAAMATLAAFPPEGLQT